MDIDNILVISNRIYPGKKNYKYFIGYMDNDYNIKTLCIMLPNTSTYVKSSDGKTKRIHFLAEDDELLKNMIFGITQATV